MDDSQREEVEAMINQAFSNVSAKLDKLLASQPSAPPVPAPSEDVIRQSAPEPVPPSSAISGESMIRPPNVVPQWCTVGGQPDANFPTLPHLSSFQQQTFFSMLPNQQLVFAPGLQHISQPSPVLPGLSITKVLPPLPAFLVQRVHSGEVIDMQLLLPSNIKRMPGTAQELEKSLTSKDKDKALDKVSSLQDWLEAFTIYSAVLSRKPGADMELMRDLLGYMALISNMAKTCPWQQISEYDYAFRRAAGAGAVSWSELDVNIWLACQSKVPKPSPPPTPQPSPAPLAPVPKSAAASKSSSDDTLKRQTCYPFNTSGCKDKACKRRHECLLCYGNHAKSACTNSGEKSSGSQSSSSHSRSRSAPASPTPKRSRRD